MLEQTAFLLGLQHEDFEATDVDTHGITLKTPLPKSPASLAIVQSELKARPPRRLDFNDKDELKSKTAKTNTKHAPPKASFKVNRGKGKKKRSSPSASLTRRR